jgi:crotonobetainyl-CoA:carnitine CoA-transferase CaiB-like acyl-CoA transferase
MARLGLGYDELRAVNSRLVYCSLSGYGQSGPYRTRVGHDINYMALSGALDLIGSHDGPPVVPGLQVADLSGGMVACISILMGLLQRQRTGEGCYCDVAMMDCVVSLLALQSEQAFASGVTPRRGSERLNGGIACFNVYRTKDGRYLSLGNLEPKFWQVFCELIERPDLVARQYDALPDHPELRAVMDDIMAGRSLAEWEALLSDTEVAWAPVLDLPEVFANPQVVARGMRRDDVVPGVIQTGSPLTLPNESASPDQAPPPRGSHTASLLREFGYADEEIARLASEKAIGLAQ